MNEARDRLRQAAAAFADALLDALTGEGTGAANAPADVPLTVKEVATLLHRSPSTIRGWLVAGVLAGFKLRGRDWRVRRADLQAFLDGLWPAASSHVPPGATTPPAPDPRSRPPRAQAGEQPDLSAWRKVRESRPG